LGACIDAPVIKINNNYYENLKLDDIKKIVKNLKK
jgi:NADH:ubiquinone oxidoreductase subunit E